MPSGWLASLTTARILTGPTGSGKSAIALELAPRLNAEIVSMDSMSVYRGMDIGTAKPTPADRVRVRHHLVDILDAGESASVAEWLKQAREACADIVARGKRPLFVGGTPLYLKALLFGLFEGPAADDTIRERLTREAEATSGAELHRKLNQVDPVAAGRIHVNDLRRIIRALEVHEITGRPLSDWQIEWSHQPCLKTEVSPTIVWVNWPRPELHERIGRRVVQMFAAGLVDETRELLKQPLSKEARQALGYREVIEHLEGRATLAQTIERVKAHTRQFAKRQVTWFRHLPGCCPIAPELTRNLWHLTI